MAARLAFDSLPERLEARTPRDPPLNPSIGGLTGDDDLVGGGAGAGSDYAGPVSDGAGLADAAVLVLFVRAGAAEQDPRVVLTERAAKLRRHAGQVSLPGGRPDPGDGGLAQTAIREAAEEVGLPRDGVEVVGRLAPVPTPSGYLISPFVAWAPVGWEPTNTSPAEVATVITPRMSTLADPAVHRVTGSRTWRGHRYTMHEFAVHRPVVWGATARILWDLLERLKA